MALKNLSLDHLRKGETYSTLEDRLVPIYLLHRYQIEAVVKLIGGIDYDYAVKGNIDYQVKTVDSSIQRNALFGFLNSLKPQNLEIPSSLRDLIPPRSFSNPRTRENFLSQTGVSFDYLGIASTLSDALISMLLHPERANRLVTQHGFDPTQLSLKETFDKLIDFYFKVNPRNYHQKQLNHIVKANILKHLMYLGKNPNSNSIVKVIVYDQLVSLDNWLAGKEEDAFNNFYRAQIDQYFENPEEFNISKPRRLPDGSPIGSYSCFY